MAQRPLTQDLTPSLFHHLPTTRHLSFLCHHCSFLPLLFSHLFFSLLIPCCHHPPTSLTSQPSLACFISPAFQSLSTPSALIPFLFPLSDSSSCFPLPFLLTLPKLTHYRPGDFLQNKIHGQ